MVAIPRASPDAARPSASRYVAQGPGVELLKWCLGDGRPTKDELLFEGPASCGKTRACWEALLVLARRHPEFRAAVVRRTRVSMTQSVLALLESQVLAHGVRGHKWIAGKGHRSHWTELRLPNGAEIAFVGMEEPTRLYSTEWHVIWVNEAQELDLRQWETLHRGLRAPGGPGWTLLIGDYNPPHRGHWICQRSEPDPRTGAPAPALLRIWRHADNPLYFDLAKGEWTDEGRTYLGKLRRTLSGPRLRSLLYGERASASGLVWPTYDELRHRITATPTKRNGMWHLHVRDWEDTDEFGPATVPLEWFVASFDFGYRVPGCLQVWGFDAAKRAFRVAEIYRAEKDLDWWAGWAATLYEEFQYRVGVADHEPSSISILNTRVGVRFGREGRAVWRPWDKRKSATDQEKAGFDQMRVRFKEDGAFLVRDAFPAGLDPALADARRPTCLEEEIPQLVYPSEDEGKILTERRREHPDPRCAQHAVDAARGLASWAWLKDLTPLARRPQRQFSSSWQQIVYEHRNKPDPYGDLEVMRRSVLRNRGIDPDRPMRPYRRRRR